MGRLAFGWSLGVMLLFGALDMFRGVVAPYLQQGFHLSYWQLGVVFSAGSVGYLLGTLITGFVVDKIGLKVAKLTGIIVTAAGLVMLTFGLNFPLLLIGFAVSGVGSGSLEISVNGTVPAIAKEQYKQSRYFNWLHGVYGLGAFVFPVLAALLIQKLHGWRPVYGGLTGMTLLLGFAIALTSYTGLTVAHRDPKAHGQTVAHLGSQPVLYGLLAAILTYVVAEMGVGSWLLTYLVHTHGMSVDRASVYLSGFYLCFTLSRLFAHLWVDRLGNVRAVFVSLFVAMVCVALGMAAGGIWTGMLIVAGLGFGPIFPTITAAASFRFAHAAGQVLGLLFTAAGVGSLLSNALIGAVSNAYGLTVGFGLVEVFLALVAVGMSVVAVASRIKPALSDEMSGNSSSR